MNKNSAVPPSGGPGPLCTAYAPLLPFLPTGGLQPEESAAARAHVAECAWCQTQLVAYDALYAALRRQYGPAVARPSVTTTPVLPALTVAQVAALAGGPASPPISVPRREASARAFAGTSVARRSVPSTVLAVAAVLLLIVFAGAIFSWQRGVGGAKTSLDPQARAYMAILRQYYPPVLDVVGQDFRDCSSTFGNIPPSSQLQTMAACRPTEVAAATASQALLAHLQTANPPARWRSANHELEQWAQALTRAFDDRVAAIDARDVARFMTLATSEVQPASDLSCAPIEQINAELPFASQLPDAAVACGA